MFNFGPRLELGSENGRGAVISNIAIILVGFGLIFLGYNTYTGQNQALENPVNVSATVTETGIDRQSSRRGGPDYQPEIIFEYSYGGQEYTSSNKDLRRLEGIKTVRPQGEKVLKIKPFSRERKGQDAEKIMGDLRKITPKISNTLDSMESIDKWEWECQA
ncbi:hypothetical protein HRED_06667 [Candidatus Haloredivivus sp. G17]|nr:hypothetical protein HRED_06667 [Candidatus Haloredivivus sp. G17]